MNRKVKCADCKIWERCHSKEFMDNNPDHTVICNSFIGKEFTYKRENNTKSVFTTKEKYNTFMESLNRTGVDIDEDIDIWINWIRRRLTERGLYEDEIDLFFERFKMAI